jgi:enolase-phosphatase E1
MIKAILLDIEGTTTPIDFVHETLFPFAVERIENYVEVNFARLAAEISQLKIEHSNEAVYNAPFDMTSPPSVSRYLRYLIDIDRKSKPLKSIQGKIWQQGYESGDIKSEIFDDVLPAFERWQREGRMITIYSSGSVLAQKLLFKYTKYGDLSAFISYYFDTNTGGKREEQSYWRIASSLNLPPDAICFVSDVPAELSAARGAGLCAALSVRPGNAPLENGENWAVVISFDAL